jgi:hypothetical protein
MDLDLIVKSYLQILSPNCTFAMRLKGKNYKVIRVSSFRND